MKRYEIDHYIQLSGPLFEAVQRQRVFEDSKQFVDMIPEHDPDTILSEWNSRKEAGGFDLTRFVQDHFRLQDTANTELDVESSSSCRDHIRMLWPHLFRTADHKTSELNSLIPLPREYVVPGGRFREIYYWDSYFTAQGLAADGHDDMVLAMVENFRYLVEEIGHIPNGNRVYYLSRSQPPFFVPLITHAASLHGSDIIRQFLPAAEKEYRFWMDQTGQKGRRTVEVPGAGRLNRYWDDRPLPREESWYEDTELAEAVDPQNRESFYRHIRAACESGWDFSSRWFADGTSLSTIQTTAILPIDLNTLLWYMESKLAEWSRASGRIADAQMYEKAFTERSRAIHELMWDEELGFYFDWNHQTEERTGRWSLAAVYPLYFGMASQKKAAAVASHLEDKFLKPGGLITTTVQTGQQWDAPNGWAPLQWMAVMGLRRYGFTELAEAISQRWLRLNENVYKRSGKMVEKYNVVDIGREGGGGEYPLQDGFGWSNGVFSALQRESA
ncbi:MAG: alpha,alpha-trehalase TreF [Bacteroidetes bacterium]|jgi:alpha,alpha-trehalase|nr:alpha,alpha-trehalase TreF [Bacteroidota bacterium]